MRKTKIIATLGPATDDPNVLREVVRAGINVARFNFSHGSHEEIKTRLALFRSVCAELGCTVAALADTKGPEIRLGTFAGGSAELAEGQPFRLVTEECVGDATHASISYAGLPGDVSAGSKILIDDGLIGLLVTKTSETEIFTEVVNGGPVSDHKSLNVPSVHLNLPFISSVDRSDLRFIAEMDFDYIAASFTRSAADISELREALHRLNRDKIRIIAKIENADGVENLEAILGVSDGLMVARGDLGVEMPLEEIPILQKRMIRHTHQRGKVVITATQMLESMIHNPRPTRAEVSDVANAIYDGTSAIMLSGETASGRYPAEVVRTMAGIAERTERAINYKGRFASSDYKPELTVVNAIAHATVTTAHDLEAAAILTVTMSGQTARNVAKFRPACPIIACTTDPVVERQLSLVWGVLPLLMDEQYETSALFEQAASLARERAQLRLGDLLVITAGVPLGLSGTTNLLKVHEIGESTKIL
ncbi:MAG: pyruvate kinase [Clostridiales bacterium]|jgi:pyruvate kinase|nr:pyruvate kinase [Clostridiales bacterium]